MILRALLSSLVCVVVNGFWEEMYVMYADNTLPNLLNYTGPYVFANQTDRQHLHYRRPPTTSPSIKHPTYFFAHGNNGTADGMRSDEIATVIMAGYAVISWESITSIKGDNDTATCWSDHQLVMKWAVDNAETLQLDTTRFVIGGRSRGSVCSWPVAHGVAYTGDLVVPDTYSVIGIHMYNALPIGSQAWTADTFPLSTVSLGSPRLQFNYGPNCTGGPVEDGPATCEPPNLSPNPVDIHNPWHGQKILLKYASLGIGGKANLMMGLTDAANADPNDNITRNILFNFPEFAATLVPPSECAPALEWACPGYAAYDFPAQCGSCASVQHHQDVLIEANCTFNIVRDLCIGTALANNLDTQAAKAAQEAVSKSMADWAKPAPAPTDGSGAATDNTKNKVSAGHKSAVVGHAAALMVVAAVVGKVLA